VNSTSVIGNDWSAKEEAAIHVPRNNSTLGWWRFDLHCDNLKPTPPIGVRTGDDEGKNVPIKQ
jgi:hypothetical protein